MRPLLQALTYYKSSSNRLLRIADAALRRFPKSTRIKSARRITIQGDDIPYHVRIGTSDFIVLEQILFHGEYDLIFPEIVDPKFILDLGANIGTSVRLWAKQFPAASIVAVEPHPDNMRMLRLNTQHLDQKLHLIQCCVAGQHSTVFLAKTGLDWEYAISNSGIPVEALTVSDILDKFRFSEEIDLLKCDIEGAESDVFANCVEWIHRVRSLVVELHAPYNRDKFFHVLKRAGWMPTNVRWFSGTDYEVVFAQRSNN